MIKNKLLTLFTLFIFCFNIPKVCFAQENEISDYEHILSGSCVTSDGFFFTENGMVKLVVNTQEKIKIAVADSQKQIDLLKVDLKKCEAIKESQLRIQKEMYESQLLAKQQALDAYKTDAFWKNIQSGVSGLILGVIIGVGGFYIVTSNR